MYIIVLVGIDTQTERRFVYYTLKSDTTFYLASFPTFSHGPLFIFFYRTRIRIIVIFKKSYVTFALDR